MAVDPRREAWRLLRTCPRCGELAGQVERRLGEPTRYRPCGHQDHLADLRLGMIQVPLTGEMVCLDCELAGWRDCPEHDGLRTSGAYGIMQALSSSWPKP